MDSSLIRKLINTNFYAGRASDDDSESGARLRVFARCPPTPRNPPPNLSFRFQASGFRRLVTLTSLSENPRPVIRSTNDIVRQQAALISWTN